jgi:hypothetical protein
MDPVPELGDIVAVLNGQIEEGVPCLDKMHHHFMLFGGQFSQRKSSMSSCPPFARRVRAAFLE